MIVDIAAQDAEGRNVLLVEVEGMKTSEDLVSKIFTYMEMEGEPVPFGMVVDPESIYIIKYCGWKRIGYDCKLDAAGVLRHYDPEFGEKRVFHGYLVVLVETWLRDLVYHWKSETPPGSEQLTEIGLLSRLREGTTRREVRLGVDSIH